jgi:magnesium transporter
MPIFKKRYAPVGSRPGTMVVPEGSLPVRTRIMTYRGARFEEPAAPSPEKTPTAVSEGAVTWIDFQGLGATEWLLDVGKAFGIHTLTLSDIVEAPQRPKTEEHPDYLFLITRMARFTDSGLDVEQVAILVRPDCVMTFQEHYCSR